VRALPFIVVLTREAPVKYEERDWIRINAKINEK